MAKSAIITLTIAGTSTGPFNLLSDVDSYVTPFETNIAKSSLIAGYTTNLIPDAATIVRVQSSSSLCTNFINLTYPGVPTTTTTSTTTTTTTAPTTTTTTTTTSTTTTTTTAGTITFTVSNPGPFPYPVSAGNGSASGTIKNNSGATIYVYSVFNSGGQGSGTIMGDTGIVAGGIALDIPGGPITTFGQTFYSTNYETLPSDNTSYAWSLQKNDGYSTATLMLGYSTTPGGTINLLFP